MFVLVFVSLCFIGARSILIMLVGL